MLTIIPLCVKCRLCCPILERSVGGHILGTISQSRYKQPIFCLLYVFSFHSAAKQLAANLPAVIASK